MSTYSHWIIVVLYFSVIIQHSFYRTSDTPPSWLPALQISIRGLCLFHTADVDKTKLSCLVPVDGLKLLWTELMTRQLDSFVGPIWKCGVNLRVLSCLDPVSNLQLFSLKYNEDYWKLSCLFANSVHTADTHKISQSCLVGGLNQGRQRHRGRIPSNIWSAGDRISYIAKVPLVPCTPAAPEIQKYLCITIVGQLVGWIHSSCNVA